MASSFAYSINQDFPDQKINVDNFVDEIRVSTISIALDGVTVNGDQVVVYFKAAISAAEKTVLDGDTLNPAGGLISQHNATPVTVDLVTIKEEYGTTNGRFFCKSVTVYADADATTVYDEPVFVDTSALMIRYTSEEDQRGDSIDVQVAPNTVVGTITADVDVGDLVINVSSSVINNVFRGPCVLTLTDGVTTNSLDRIKTIDKMNNQITVETAAQNSFLAATPTFVMMTIIVMKDRVIGPPLEYTIGSSKIGGSFVPQDTIVRVIYKNRTPAEEVGTVTANIALNDNVLKVNAAVTDRLIYNDKVAVRQNTTIISLGSVIKVDKAREEITVSVPASATVDLMNGVIYVQKTAKVFLANIEMLQ